MIQPIRGNFVKVLSAKETEKRNLSGLLVTFFACAQLIFGFKFGFVESSGRMKTAPNLVTVLSGSVMILILVLSFSVEITGKRLFLGSLVQYVPIFIIMFIAKYTLYDFLTDLPNEWEPTPTKTEYKKVDILLWLYAALIFGTKTATAIIYCAYTLCTDIRWTMINIAMHVPVIALDIIPIASLIVFYHTYTCMRKMTARYDNGEISLKQLQNTFKELADNFEKFRSNYDAIFVWWFLTESVKWMFIIWNHLTLMKLSSLWWLHGSSYTWAFFNTVQICVPAVFAEMISVQTDAMKLSLNERVLVERDETKKLEILCLLRYMEARPLLRKAWRLVPLDLQLPLTMLSICTTYLIVIIQFTHLFD